MFLHHLSAAITIAVAINCISGEDQVPCIRQYFDEPGSTSFACVCNSTYCDNLPRPTLPDEGSYLVITSDKDKFRFHPKIRDFVEDYEDSDASNQTIQARFVLTSKKKQTILGFGGAVTDSAALNVLSLSSPVQEKLLESYYSENGLEYTINRINIGGCDFSSRGYTYVDTPGDEDLETFALQEEDLEQKIPVLQRIASMSPNSMKTIAAAWTAPAWMKTNNDLIGAGKLLEEYYQTYAEYHVKFLDAYEAHNISIWGMSAQNEPLDGLVPNFSFNCMGWTAEDQTQFIAENLGPSLEESGYGDLKLMAMDDQRINLPSWVETVFNNSVASDYVSGVAVHWYVDYFSPDVLTETHELFPDKFILYTEACEGDGPAENSLEPGSWHRLETYAKDIIEDLENWVVGWVDWNIALDTQGGPNWCGNFVDSPIIVNATSDTFYKNPMFYAMGHFSKFIRPGAVHLTLEAVNGTDGGIFTTAFRNTNEDTVLVVLNDQDETVSTIFEIDERGVINLDISPRSLITILFQ